MGAGWSGECALNRALRIAERVAAAGPRWTAVSSLAGRDIAWISAALCALSIPAMFAGPADASGFYNPGG